MSFIYSGYILSKWSIDMEKGSKDFFALPSEGEVEVGKSSLLNLFYIPRTKGYSTATIAIRVAGNLKAYNLKLHGTGSEPNLLINDSILKFKCTLPHSNESEIFTIQNVSNFPVEFCFSELNR